MKHSRGPWRLTDKGELRGASGAIGLVYSWSAADSATRDEAAANARAIVNVPDMLATLRALLDAVDAEDQRDGIGFDLEAKAEEARTLLRVIDA